MIIKGQEIPEIKMPDSPVVLKRIIQRGQHSDDISVTWVRLSGHHKRSVSDSCDRVYYIIEGDAEFQVGDEVPARTCKGDFVFIPRGTPYHLDGDVTYLLLNGPALVPGSDRILE